MCYCSNVHTVWITAGEAAICQINWCVCLISNKEPKIINCPLWKIPPYSDLQWMLLGSVKPVALNNRFMKNEEFYFHTSRPSIWYAWIFNVFFLFFFCFFFVFVFQLVQLIPMAGIVEKHVDIVHRMLHVTGEVVYV